MSNPLWLTNCNISSNSSNACKLPIIGLTGSNINTRPIYIPKEPKSLSDSCFVLAFQKPCSSSDQQYTCNSISCGPGNKPVPNGCSCTNPVCDENTKTWVSCVYDYTCTQQCQQMDTDLSCPDGTFTGYDNLNAICNYDTSKNFPWLNSHLPDAFTIPMNQRYSLSTYLAEWMRQLYKDPSSDFHTSFNFTNSDDDQIIRTDIAGSSGVYKYDNPSGFWDWVQKVPSYPQFFYLAPNTYGIVQFIYYTDPSFNPNLDASDITNLIKMFTVETMGQHQPGLSHPYLFNNNTAPNINNTPLVFGTYPSYDNLTNNPSDKYYIFVDLDKQQVYNQNLSQPLVSIKDLLNSGKMGDYYIIGRLYPSIITNWSPNLLYLFAKSFQLVPDNFYTKDNCNTISYQSGQIPLICFQNDCGNLTDDCFDKIQQKCPLGNLYDTQFGGIKIDAQQFFLQSASPPCQCFSTTLAPDTIAQPVIPAMCFDSNCTNNQAFIQKYGLTDNVCGKYCQTVYDWVTSSDPATRSKRSEVLDRGRFGKLCWDFDPTNRFELFNYYALGIGIVVTILASIVAYFLSKKWWVVIIIAVIFLAITVFMAKDMNGVPVVPCSNNQPVCKSSITNITIPNSWCSFHVGCECNNYGEQCGNGKICQAGLCLPIPQSPAPPTSQI